MIFTILLDIKTKDDIEQCPVKLEEHMTSLGTYNLWTRSESKYISGSDK